MDLIEKIGPFVGLAAFVGLAVLAFLLFQQSRDLRRLREWAGRAPERAKEAADASLAAAEARGEATAEEEGPGPFARAWTAFTGFVRPRYEAFDRNMPIDGRIILGILGAAVIAAGVLTGGFGLVGDGGGDGQGTAKAQKKKEQKPEVAILNATQTPEVIGVAGLADKVANEVVKQLGYPLGVRTDAPTGFPETVVMYKPGKEGDAAQLAREISKQLGETQTAEVGPDVEETAEGAPLVLVIGADDATF